MAHDHSFSDVYGFASSFVVDPQAQTVLEVNAVEGWTPPAKMPGNACFASSPAEFSRLSAAGKNILIHFWTPSAELSSQLKQRPFADLPELDLKFKRRDLDAVLASVRGPLATEVLLQLKPAILRTAELAGAKRLHLAFGKLREQMCPTFHVDRIVLRLICTLRGPGTEWLDDAEVRRENLGKGSNDAILAPNATIYQLDALQVGVLKGTEFPGSRRLGVVHRSPAVDPAGDGRWYLRVDMLAR